MRKGGVSWNNSVNSKKGVLSRHKCSICHRQYKMESAKNTHEKLCKENSESK